MRQLLAGLALVDVPLPAALCADIDTPADLAAHEPPRPRPGQADRFRRRPLSCERTKAGERFPRASQPPDPWPNPCDRGPMLNVEAPSHDVPHCPADGLRMIATMVGWRCPLCGLARLPELS